MAVLGIAIIVLILMPIFLVVLLIKNDYSITVKRDRFDENWEYDFHTGGLFALAQKLLNKKTKNSVEVGNEEENEQKSFNFKDLIKNIKNFDNSTAKKLFGHTLEYIKSLLVRLRPKKVILRGTIGASEPDKTGYILAAIYAAAPLLNLDAKVDGDFENEVFEIYFYIWGSLRLWSVFLPTIKYIMKPEVRQLIIKKKPKTKFKKRKDELNGYRAKQ